MIYDSVIHMNLMDVSGYLGQWRRQTTLIRPVLVPWNMIDSNAGQLTSSANILLGEEQVCCVFVMDHIHVVISHQQVFMQINRT